ncbi:MFS transporter [Mycolicibacterium holsaticum]|uniref:MFS transporter n=1 Tax=Mycolicibacterium holsaticum TaxID=152142 RepID=UPI001C7DADB6|nr:MFS transporter [Mycolicibacterium holsaticum]MDA4107188.1 major facilitator transporter [Mycolicibacterium holsaticum DSM 44478 = JCM 12374]QZA15007.1 MFS transporter [Mycolicibacterium holsaticum DSM 44478 = JCM 12374]UNC07556.1 MFS transporter [Mycolicibacterium holsaticum DSM 44478 = JCM 12374]
MTDRAPITAGSWRELLGPKNLGASTVLAGGVALYATNEFLTISLMPSAVADIGGYRLYAWATTVYLVASVVAATTVYSALMRFGPRRSYLFALTVFGAGSVACAAAPTMETLLVGRTVQGLAGGLLAGLGYAVISTALPSMLWTKASALVSAMWGVGTLLGPAAGGLFAQFGSWRWAFGVLAVLTVAMAVLVPVALPARNDAAVEAATTPVPVWSLMLLGLAALAVSVAGLPRDARATVGLLVLSGALVAAFLYVDRRRPAAVLPPSAFRAGPLKWIYLTLGLLMAATMADMYVPLFGQRLAHLTPVAAGFLGAGLAIGWTASEIGSASLRTDRTIRRTVALAPLVMAIGLAVTAATVSDDASAARVAVWAFALFVTGAGVGLAWPHLSAWAMSRVDDPAEGPAAAAAINTVQLISGAFGAGLAGVVVNVTETGGATPARWLFAAFAALAAIGVLASVRSGRPYPAYAAKLRSGS